MFVFFYPYRMFLKIKCLEISNYMLRRQFLYWKPGSPSTQTVKNTGYTIENQTLISVHNSNINEQLLVNCS